MKKEQNENSSGKREKSTLLLIVGAILLAAAIAFTIYAHGGSYAASLATGSQLSEVKETIKSVEAGETAGDLEALKAQQTELAALKLRQGPVQRADRQYQSPGKHQAAGDGRSYGRPVLHRLCRV